MVVKASPLNAMRWDESRKFLKLCADSLRIGDEQGALNWLHEAHNLGRDHVGLHVATHLRYVRFSFYEGNYRRALGHMFWALSSPILVPMARARRTAIVGEWTPAPRTSTIAQANVILLVDVIAGETGVDGREVSVLLEAAPTSAEQTGTSSRTAPLSSLSTIPQVTPAPSSGSQVSLSDVTLPPRAAVALRAAKEPR